MFDEYVGISPKSDLVLLQILAARLNKKSFLHINSTREGGGVAEILQRMIPILTELGIDAKWEVIEGDPVFFDITKILFSHRRKKIKTILKEKYKENINDISFIEKRVEELTPEQIGKLINELFLTTVKK